MTTAFPVPQGNVTLASQIIATIDIKTKLTKRRNERFRALRLLRGRRPWRPPQITPARKPLPPPLTMAPAPVPVLKHHQWSIRSTLRSTPPMSKTLPHILPVHRPSPSAGAAIWLGRHHRRRSRLSGTQLTTSPYRGWEIPTSNHVPVSSKNTMESVKEVLGKWGKKFGETAKKTEDLAGNFWQHLKTGPSFADAALGRVAQGTKVIAEGGYEKIFQQTFDTFPEEQLKKTYACYLSTSAGPVMGTLYLSTAKLAFCSDNPLSYTIMDKTEWSYYKVVIPLRQLRSVNPSKSKVNSAEKYIQIVSVDNHEFWFMGFLNYDSAVNHLQEALNDSSHFQP